jgi:hypothetical protein
MCFQILIPGKPRSDSFAGIASRLRKGTSFDETQVVLKKDSIPGRKGIPVFLKKLAINSFKVLKINRGFLL